MFGTLRRMSRTQRGDRGTIAAQAQWLHRNQVKFLQDNNKKRNRDDNDTMSNIPVVAAEACTEVE